MLGCLPHSQDVPMHLQIMHYSSYADHPTILVESCVVYVHVSIECTYTSICVVWKHFSCYTAVKIDKNKKNP